MRSAKTLTAPFASFTVPVFNDFKGEILSAKKRPAESFASFALPN